MRQLSYLTVLLAVLILHGCAGADQPFKEAGSEAFITGRSYQDMLADDASTTTEYTFATGMEALFNASGGLVLHDETLTYSGSQWQSKHGLQWEESAEEVTLTALYPVLEYAAGGLYPNGKLEDVLYAKGVFPTGEPISLQFNHLFSSMKFQLSPYLQRKFKEISLTCPIVVSSVSTQTTEFQTAAGVHTTTISTASPDGTYAFIVPPTTEEVGCTLRVTTTEKAYNPAIVTRSFAQGMEYTYNVISEEKGPGIQTVEDFIAFSQLINSTTSTEYEGKTLADFGETDADGVTTYYLLNDLDFEGKDISKLKQIGYYSTENTRFKDIFDGQGHTISHLTPVSSYGTTGVFGAIGSTGIVKNLHMQSCEAVVTTGFSAILAGHNYGTIMNCSVTEGSISSDKDGVIIGGLAGSLREGTIANCYVKDMEISSASDCGGIVGMSKGNILNCFSANNTLSTSDERNGGISGNSIESPTTLSNCYAYNLRQTKGKYRGVFFGAAQNSTLTNCFYGSNNITKAIGSGSGNTGSVTSISTLTTPLHEHLNAWIDENQPLYPDLPFTRWKEGDTNLPALFVP